jgi:hypothetical protein
MKPSCLAIDATNCIWVGSENGVYYYDGYNWVNYNMQNSNLVSNSVSDIASGRNGNIIVCYDRSYVGVSLFNYAGLLLLGPDVVCQAPISIINNGVVLNVIKTSIGYIYGIVENTRYTVIASSSLIVMDAYSDKFKIYNSSNSNLTDNPIYRLRQIDEYNYILFAGKDNISYVNLSGGFTVKNFKIPSSLSNQRILLDQVVLERIIKECKDDNNCNYCSDLIGVDNKGGTWFRKDVGLVREIGNKKILFKTDKISDSFFNNILFLEDKIWFQSSGKITLLKYTD